MTKSNLSVQTSHHTRDVTLLSDPDTTPSKLFILLDAEIYLEKMDAVETIRSLREEGRCAGVAWALVSHVDSAHRHADFACDEAYGKFVADDVFAAMHGRLPSLEEGGHFIGGVSLSGLSAAYILTQHPKRFDRALCQSGSFWWNDEWLAENAPGLKGKTLYLSVGDQEVQSGLTHAPTEMKQDVSQLYACQRFAARAEKQGNRIRFEIFEGGHNPEFWAAELKKALKWLRKPG